MTFRFALPRRALIRSMLTTLALAGLAAAANAQPFASPAEECLAKVGPRYDPAFLEKYGPRQGIVFVYETQGTCQQAVNADPNDLGSLVRLGLAQLAAPRRQDWPAGVATLEDAASRGSALAEYALGLLYEDGPLSYIDRKKAFGWFSRAAERGFPDAQFKLFELYRDGAGVTADGELAQKWLNASWDSRSGGALNIVARQHLYGNGREQDTAKAVSYFEESMRKGNVDAMLNLGILYAHGVGVEKDETLAVSHFLHAGSLGNCRANLMYTNAVYYGTGTPRDLNLAHYRFQSFADFCHYPRAWLWAASIRLDIGYLDGALSDVRNGLHAAEMAGDTQLVNEAKRMLREIEARRNRLSPEQVQQALIGLGIVAAVVGAFVVLAANSDTPTVVHYQPVSPNNAGFNAAAELIWLDGKF